MADFIVPVVLVCDLYPFLKQILSIVLKCQINAVLKTLNIADPVNDIVFKLPGLHVWNFSDDDRLAKG
jgi:hypothetical protein